MKKLATRFMSMTMVLIAMFCFCAQPAFAQKSAGRAPMASHRTVVSEPVRSLTSDALICVSGTDVSHFTLGNPGAITSFGVTASVFTNSAEYYNGVYYFANTTNGDFGTIDPATGNMTVIATGNNCAAVAYNPADGQLYGLKIGNSPVLYTINPATGAESQVIASTSTDFVLGMTITNDGRILVIDGTANGIAELNPTTGALTTIITPGFSVNYGQDLAMDRETNTPYWAAYNADDSDGQLYSLDLSTNTATLIGSFGNQVSGFATMTTNNPNIAAAPTNFTITPDANLGLSAALSWTNPTTTLGGTALTSINSIELYRGGVLVQSFANPTVGGAMTYTDNTVPAAGRYNYTVYAVTSEGNGVSAAASEIIGDLCATQIPYSYGFDNAEIFDNCWEVIDANNDGKTFSLNSGVVRYAYSSTNAANDWLISPEFTLTGNEYVSFEYRAQSSTYPEKFEVYAINGTDTTIIAPEETVSATAFATKVIQLTSFTGATKIAIKCTSDADKYYFVVDNFTVASAQSTITLNPTSIDFGTLGAGTTSSATFEVATIAVYDAMTVSTTAPFAVSLDGNTYSTSITIPAATSFNNTTTVYAQYAPTAAGTSNGTITIANGTLSETVALTGEAIECSAISEYPYVCNFDNEAQNLCWTVLDNNNDGSTFTLGGNYDGAWYLYSSANQADDWLISPEFVLDGNQYVSFDYYIDYDPYPEKFSVHLLQGSTDVVLVPTATYLNMDPETMTIDLSSYTGTYQIAIYAESDADMDAFFINNFTVGSISDLVASLTVNPTAIDFGTIFMGSYGDATVEVSTVVAMDPITVTTAAPFAVSLDGTTYGDNVTIPAATSISNTTTLYVKYTPTAVGTDNGTIALACDTLTATVTLNGSAIDCSQAAALPFFEDFEDELSACWQNIDRDGDGNAWFNAMENDLEAYDGIGAFVSASYINNVGALTPDNWLITPAIAIPAEGAHMSWFVAAQDPSYPSEYYQVMVSTGSNPSEFSTIVFSETLVSGDWEQRDVNLAAYAGQNIYIAFVHMNTSDEYMMKIDNLNIEAGIGIEDNEANSFRVFPNPATNMINVEAQGFEQYQLVNMLGQNVMSSNLINGNAQINVSNLSNGVYYVRLINGNAVETIKVVKK